MTDKQKIKILKEQLRQVNKAVKECSKVNIDPDVIHTTAGKAMVDEIKAYQEALKWAIGIVVAWDKWGKGE